MYCGNAGLSILFKCKSLGTSNNFLGCGYPSGSCRLQWLASQPDHETLSFTKFCIKPVLCRTAKWISTLGASDPLGSASCLSWQKQVLCKVILREHKLYAYHIDSIFIIGTTFCHVED